MGPIVAHPPRRPAPAPPGVAGQPMSFPAHGRLFLREAAGPAAQTRRHEMRDLVVHAWTSLDGFSCDEETEMFRVMGEVDDPVGDDLFAQRLWGAGTHIMGR